MSLSLFPDALSCSYRSSSCWCCLRGTAQPPKKPSEFTDSDIFDVDVVSNDNPKTITFENELHDLDED